MKKVIIVILILCTCLFAQIKVIHPTVPFGGFSDIHFFNDKAGLAVVAKSVVRTTDSGNTWKEVMKFDMDVGDKFQIINSDSLFVINEYHVFLSSDSGKSWRNFLNVSDIPHDNNMYFISIQKTNNKSYCISGYIHNVASNTYTVVLIKSSDNGQSWSIEEIPITNCDLSDAYFIDENEGWILITSMQDFKRYIYHTSDGGKTWQRQLGGQGLFIISLKIFDYNTVFATARNYSLTEIYIYKSVDKGISWKSIHIPEISQNLNFKVAFTDEEKWTILGYRKKLIKTEDGGETWETSEMNFELSSLKPLSLEATETFVFAGFGMSFLFRMNNLDKSWESIGATTQRDLVDVCFVDSSVGWVTGKNGFIMATTNGGLSWTKQDSRKGINLFIDFVDRENGWGVGAGGTVIHTEDGGNHWESQTSNTINNLFDVYFFDKNLGWALGYNSNEVDGTIIKTTDGGENWNKVLEGFKGKLYNFSFASADKGWVSGSKVLSTEDGGETWKILTEEGCANLSFYDENRGWRIRNSGGNAYLEFTTDGGRVWFERLHDYSGYGHSTDFEHILAVDGNTIIYTSDVWVKPEGYYYINYSTNGGDNWENFKISSDGLNSVNNMSASPIKDIYAVGRSGVVWKIDYNSLITDVKENRNLGDLPKLFNLSQNYPNPFNPTTKIKFTIPQDVKRETSNVKLIVYDILGREIKTLINKPMQPGNYEVEFEGDNLPSGVYFYRLEVDKYSEIKKMLYLK